MGTTRIALWDNARWILLVLVVWGHILNDLPDASAPQHWADLLLYVFHIPALIFLSGYFAPTDLRKTLRTVWQLAVTWLIFEALWAAERALTGGQAFGRNFLAIPSWTLWFLVTLVLLLIALPFLVATRFPLVISIVVSLAAGLLPSVGPQWSLARTAYLLPFFVLGHLCRRRGLGELRWFREPSWSLRAGALAVVFAVGAVAWLAREPIEGLGARTWAAGYLPYASLLDPREIDVWWGLLVRVALLVVGSVMAFAFLVLVPRTASVVTPWGARTLYIYLLHTFVLQILFAMGAREVVAGRRGLMLAVTAAAAVVLAAALSTKPVVAATRFVVEPSLRPLLSRSGPPSA